jgi:hypothetical protein
MIVAALALAVELLHVEPESKRARDLFTALTQAAPSQGVHVVPSTTYRGDAPWLLLWGPGEPSRAKVLARHVAAGGRCVALDLAYWDRDRKVRLSIDAAHPAAWVMRRDWPLERFAVDRVAVADRWKPTGPVLIAGLGDKARVQYGAQAVDRWEVEMVRTCQARWPGRPVLYRKKKAWSPVPAEAQVAPMRPIDEALVGLSLVVTWHSNVAVDAIRMGIPVICRDGAAAAVCPSALGVEDPRPLPAPVRERFLGNLAWFQWAPHEARECWRFLREILA